MGLFTWRGTSAIFGFLLIVGSIVVFILPFNLEEFGPTLADPLRDASTTKLGVYLSAKGFIVGAAVAVVVGILFFGLGLSYYLPQYDVLLGVAAVFSAVEQKVIEGLGERFVFHDHLIRNNYARGALLVLVSAAGISSVILFPDILVPQAFTPLAKCVEGSDCYVVDLGSSKPIDPDALPVNCSVQFTLEDREQLLCIKWSGFDITAMSTALAAAYAFFELQIAIASAVTLILLMLSDTKRNILVVLTSVLGLAGYILYVIVVLGVFGPVMEKYTLSDLIQATALLIQAFCMSIAVAKTSSSDACTALPCLKPPSDAKSIPMNKIAPL